MFIYLCIHSFFKDEKITHVFSIKLIITYAYNETKSAVTDTFHVNLH